MSYTAWSVVFGEQPSAAKWNILGTNDAGFKDGTNIDPDVITDAKLTYGKIRTRQGGSATNWATAGTTGYDYSATNVFRECGSSTSTAGLTKTVTFPTAFNQVPNVQLTPIRSGATAIAVLDSVSATQFQFSVWTDAGVSIAVDTLWTAEGQ